MVHGRDESISRRRFLELAGAAGVTAFAAACGSGPSGGGSNPVAKAGAGPSPSFLSPSSKLSGDLKILQWSHFVPHYDQWFDPYAKDWGSKAGVNVTVDHIDQADIPSRTASEISAGSGHDLIEWVTPPSAYEPSVLDLTDLNQEALHRFGDQQKFATMSSFNPHTGRHFGYCHAWVPDPGDYRKTLWKKAGMANGPSTYDELLKGGAEIKKAGVRMGIGMSNEVDSNMAARAIIWSFGGSIQDAHDNVVLNSDNTVAAVEYMTKLFKQTMNSEVFSWNAASNNQGLIAGQLSYILNSISAYRSAQDAEPKVANDVFFTPALKGPSGRSLASQHVVLVYIIPKHAKNPDAAKEFLLNLTANEPAVTYNSELYNFPAFPKTVSQLDGWLAKDPFGSKPANKLALLKDSPSWTTNVGHPGAANAAVGEVFTTFVISQMMASAAQGKKSAKEAVADADRQCKNIFAKWRSQGLIGGSG